MKIKLFVNALIKFLAGLLLTGLLLFRERLTKQQLAGICVILVALVLLNI